MAVSELFVCECEFAFEHTWAGPGPSAQSADGRHLCGGNWVMEFGVWSTRGCHLEVLRKFSTPAEMQFNSELKYLYI